jgi:transposase
VGRIRPGRGRPPEIPDATINQIVGDTLHTRPDDGSTHWTTRTMGDRFGVGKDTVARIWRARNIKPWLVDTFKLSTDPRFEEKLVDVVGLYHSPPEHAVVLCADEKSQIQALERSQPSLPMTPGRAGTMTHDYKRHGTTTLFAAMDIATGEVLTSYKPRHRNQEWLEFLKLIDRTVPDDLEIHLVADNYGAHKHENVTKWLEHPSRRDRWHIHYTPTSSSWLNLIERWFRELTDKRLRRDSFTSVQQLIDAIKLWTEHWNDDPKPFIWHKTAEEIIAKVRRGRAALDQITDSATDH